MSNNRVLRVKNLNVRYQTQQGPVHAVNDVSFDVFQDEVFGIAGESGCGKSTLIRALMRLLPDSAEVTANEITLSGQNLESMPERRFREEVLWSKMSLVPQSAMNSLNPVYRVGNQIMEAIQAHSSKTNAQARERTAHLFDIVGLQPDLMDNYPHEFSGGMRQRAMIAMSLALDPGLIIMDEPTTGLDVLVQERILRRIREIREEISSSIILITHDIAVIAEMSDRIAVMYGGYFMEQATAIDLFETPSHPYTLGLKNAFPSIRRKGQELISIPGSPPTLIGECKGCPFWERCPFSVEHCSNETPAIEKLAQYHEVRCFRHKDTPQLRELASKKGTWLSLD
ncbi:MAG: ABC transporter ATP-binding protein [Desulfobacula sp.]|jgi:peptide/nickel transport system ATP-binding protein|uniref:ABC transporter ATP-binding protein n=1 Tax=Desulfobacula sp. TaxID=2593537 RepID=UPI001DC1BF87|nr:ABC transporter ATP-binding protein [Deltaproteobacteria bacterium]MBT3487016.1 ABC transporter ATP-binding protein [Desulfobacula sp.]MBT4025870.1 ABC transporter ATP-binding protein [Desulfobacula sp.]MBT4878093.1 ABC transporter ATP-binding protein [Desulfobacula sp.]MBT5545504.1 ABC transporter ATP-binding protein [Desulfobacula sp.]